MSGLRWLRRVAILLLGLSGLLVLFGVAAWANMQMQHCEPVKRR